MLPINTIVNYPRGGHYKENENGEVMRTADGMCGPACGHGLNSPVCDRIYIMTVEEACELHKKQCPICSQPLDS